MILVDRPERDWRLSVGDICVLNSGSPVMEVVDVSSDGSRIVRWFDGGKIQTKAFPSACIRPPVQMRILVDRAGK